MSSITQIYPPGATTHLDDSTVLWRYIPLRTLILYLTGSAFVPSIQLLRKNDPFEGEFHFTTPLFNYLMDDQFGDQVELIGTWLREELCTKSEQKHIKMNHAFPNYGWDILSKHYFAFLRKTRFAWCWFQSEFESSAMWNIYGKEGVAVATTIKQLREVLSQTPHDFAFGGMCYVHLSDGEVRDFDVYRKEKWERNIMLRPHFLKRNEYQSEKEVRFVMVQPEHGQSGVIIDNLRPSEWINKILLWPKLKPSEEKVIQKAVSHFDPTISCRCSDLFGADRNFNGGFESAVLNGLDGIVLRKWHDGTDDIPSQLKEL